MNTKVNEVINKSKFLDDSEKDFYSEFLHLLTKEEQKRFIEFIAEYEKILGEMGEKHKQAIRNLNRKHTQEWKDFIKTEKDKTLRAVQDKIGEIEGKKIEKIRDQLK